MTADTLLAQARPRLRADVVLGPPLRDGAGVTHTIKDPRSGWYFRVGPREFFIMSRLDGRRSLAEIGDEYAGQFGRRLGEPQWRQMLGLLGGRRLLVGTDDRAALAAMSDAARRQRQGRSSLLHRRFPLTDPDRLFDWLEPRLRPLFSPLFVLPMLVAALAMEAAVACSAGPLYRQIKADWHYAPAWIGYLVVMWVGLVLHETAHGVTSKHFGGTASEIGFLWRFPVFAPYCKADDVLLFPNRWHRVYTAFAGVFINLILLLPVGALWLFTPPGGVIRALVAPLLLFGSIAALANLVPFLQLDGYFMLSHSLNMVNLRQASYRYWGQLALRWLLRRPVPVRYPRGPRWAYLLYGGASVLFLAGLTALVLTDWYRWLADRVGGDTAGRLLTGGLVLCAAAGLLAARQTRLRARRAPQTAAEAVRRLEAEAPSADWAARTAGWAKR